MATIESETVVLKRRDLAANVIVFLDGLGFGIVVPLLPFVIMAYGGSASVVTQLVGLYALASFFGGALIGELSDRFGRVRMVRATLIGSILAYLGLAFVQFLPGIFLFRALSGLMTGRDSVVRAMATDDLPEDRHIQKLGTLAAVYAIGAALGPAVSSGIGLLTEEGPAHFRAVFLLAVAVTSGTSVLVWSAWRKPDAPRGHVERRQPQTGRYRALLLVPVPLIVAFLGSFAYASILSVTALYGHATFGWSSVETGWALVVISLAIAVGRMVIAPWSARNLGVDQTLLGCIVLGVLSLLAVRFANSQILYGLALVVVALATTGITVVTTGMISQRAPANHRGFLFGAAQALWAAALFIGASLNGVLFERVGHDAPYLVAAAVLVCAAPIVIVRLGRRLVASPQSS